MYKFGISLYKNSQFFSPKDYLKDALKNGPFILRDKFKISLSVSQKKDIFGAVKSQEVLQVESLENQALGVLKIQSASSYKYGERTSYWGHYEQREGWTEEQAKTFLVLLTEFLLEEQEKVLKQRNRKLAKERKERKKREAAELGITLEELKKKKSLARKSKRRKKKSSKITEYTKHTTIVLGKIRAQKERLEELEKLLVQNIELANNMQNPGSSKIFNGFNQKYTWSLNSYKDSLKKRIENITSED